MEPYTKKLEGIIKQMLSPLKGLPFKLVIEGISGYKVLAFDLEDAKNKELIENLKTVAKSACKEVNKNGIERPRPNEVGNDIEPFIKNALTTIGYKADTPKTKDGKKKSTGYPDIEFEDNYKRTNYLECKTFNIDNVNTTQRSFYLSPSEDFKVTRNAYHLAICFEIYVEGRKGINNVYKCKSWKLLNLENLDIDVKYEFNSDNHRMYDSSLLLAEGNIN
ncbi:type II site-specific deoxyribonuclease [Candidatus Magnetoovum chiemensis]|nr:type II site-specific deoxyribonuclease [Candidatus Magnetoovum chiemensis]